MYDRDLRAWYRDLFRYAPPGKSRRRGKAPDPHPAGTGARHMLVPGHPTYADVQVGSDSQRTSDHERPQATR